MNARRCWFLTAMMLFTLVGGHQNQALAQTLPGAVSASWMGQSLGTGEIGEGSILGVHVQPEIQDMVTAPDGTCYTNSGYDEAGNNCSWYKNGQFIGRIFYNGIGGVIATAVAVNATTAYQGSSGNIYSFATGQSGTVTPNGPYAVSSNPTYTPITGLAATNSEVYAAVAGDNKVYVLNPTTLALIRSWSITAPEQVCVETSNTTLWIVSGTTVKHYDINGNYLGQQITTVSQPSALCVNGSNSLLVGDQGTDENIKIFGSIDTSPTQTGTFGTTGGIFAGTGSTIGTAGPLRFNQVTGVGVDSTGNINVSSNRGIKGGGAVLESYTSGGTRNWPLYGLEFEDVGSMDPTTNGADVYTIERHYKIDYTKGQAQQWSYQGYTVNPHKYPQDPRNFATNLFFTSAVVRRISGQLFLYEMDQTGSILGIFRFNSSTDGETAIPSGFFSSYGSVSGGWAPSQPTSGAWIWRDSNGNQIPDASEFVQTSGTTVNDAQATYVDDNGTVWLGVNQLISEFPCQGLDSYGNPIYNYTSSVNVSNLTDYTNIQRVLYDAPNDTMYVSGYTPTLTYDAAGVAGKEISAYPHWSTGNRTASWATVFPYTFSEGNPGLNDLPKAICMAGSYLFVAYYNAGSPHVNVYTKSGGTLVGQLTYPTSNVEGPDVDTYYGVQAFLRTNGEYEVTVDGYRGAKIVLFHWYPGPGSISPSNLTATSGNGQVNLLWTGATVATSYNVYRGTSSGGESSTALATGLTTTSYTDSSVVNGITYYYTIAAVNGTGITGVSNEASAQPSEGLGTNLPSPWVDTDIGSPSLTGSASYASSVFTVTGCGLDIWSNSDQFNYMYQTLPGDGSIVARCTAEQDLNSWVKVGVMMRDTTNASSNYVDMLVTPGNGVQQEFRNDSYPTCNGVASSGAVPVWLKLVRSGTNVTSFYAPDMSGSPGTWTQVGAAEPVASETITVGLAVCSHDSGNLATATFDNVTITGVPAPTNPTSLTATPGNGLVNLAWAASSGATSYGIYRGTSSGGEGASPVATGVTSTTYTDSGLSNGTTYYYEVIAVGTGGSSGYSNEAHATPSGTPPAAPTSLAAAGGNAQVVLTWAASSGATSYNIYRGTSSGGESGTAIATGITTTTYTNTGLTNGTTYYYEVKAVNSGGTSGYSNEAHATPQVPAPAAPTGLGATAGNAQVTLSWTASAGATSYNVYRGTSSGGESTTAIVTGVTTTSYTNTGLANGTTYYYEVKAVNAGGVSGYSNEANATPQVPAPPAPTGLGATAGNAQVVLSWTASSGATSYNVYRGTSSGGESTTAIVTGVTTTTYTNTGLTNGTTYYYEVKAVNAGGVSPYSNEANATPQVPAPPAPTDLGATAGNTQVVLSWTASSGAASYNVYRGTSSGGESTTAIVTGVTSTTYTNTGLTNGTTYYYEVKAVNAGGVSPYSNEASATPTAGGSAPAAPTGLTAMGGNAQVSLSWTASSGATSYNVYWGTSAGGESTTPVATGITLTSYAYAGLTNGTTYYFKVAAVNSTGTSGYSNEANAIPAAGSGGNTASIVYAPSAPTIDGNADAVWSNATLYSVGKVAFGSTSDTASWKTMWDSTNLYFLVTVADSALVDGSPDTNGDAVELYVDGTNSKTTTYGPHDFQYVLGYGHSSITEYAHGATSGVQYAQTLVAGGYQMEFAIPWSTIGVTPSAGNAIGVDVAVDDATTVGGGRTAQLIWNGTTQDYANPSLFGTGNLLSASAPAAPTGLTATPGNAQVALSWTASTGATSYNIYRGATAGGESGTAIATGISTTSYTNTGLANGTTYYYKVAAVNSAGTSGYSNEASATPISSGSGTTSIYHTATAPTIDGTADAVWSNAVSNSIAKVGFGSTTDSGSFKAMWDSSNLYVLVTVQDSALYSGSPDYTGDAVELYIDSTDSKTTSYGSTDFQYVLGWTHTSISEYAHSATTGVQFAQINISGGYQMEFAFPWTTLGVTPAAGNHIGFDAAIDDATSPTSGRTCQLLWNGTTQDYANPSLFGTGTLSP